MAKRRKPGRIYTLVGKVRANFIRLLQAGVNRKGAAALAGITYQTVINEIARNPTLAVDMAEAEEYARAKKEQEFFKGSKDDPAKYAERWLSRRHYEDWAQRRPEAIDLRKFLRHAPALVSRVIADLPTEKHYEFNAWFQQWIEGLLNDDGNA